MTHRDSHHSRTNDVWTGPKLDGNNYELYTKALYPFLRHYADPGLTAEDFIDRLPIPCNIHDLIPSTNSYMYDHLIQATDSITGIVSFLLNLPTNSFIIFNEPGATVTVPNAFTGSTIVYVISDRLSQTGHTHFLSDVKTRKQEILDYLDTSAKLIDLCLTGHTIEVQSAMDLKPTFAAAKKANLILPFALGLKEAYGHCKNGRLICVRTQSGFLLRQNGTHDDFCHAILDFEKTLKADLGGTDPHPVHGQVWTSHDPLKPLNITGYVSIRDLVTIIYQSGLNPNDFAMRMENFYSNNPSGVMVGSLETNMADNTIYLNTKATALLTNPEPTTSLFTPTSNAWTSKKPINLNNGGKPSQPSTPQTPRPPPVLVNNGAETICTICNKPFPTQKQYHDNTKYFTRCKDCSKDWAMKKLTSKEGQTKLQPAAPITSPKPSLDPKSIAAAKSLLTLFEKYDDEGHFLNPNESLLTSSHFEDASAAPTFWEDETEDFTPRTDVPLPLVAMEFDLPDLFYQSTIDPIPQSDDLPLAAPTETIPLNNRKRPVKKLKPQPDNLFFAALVAAIAFNNKNKSMKKRKLPPSSTSPVDEPIQRPPHVANPARTLTIKALQSNPTNKRSSQLHRRNRNRFHPSAYRRRRHFICTTLARIAQKPPPTAPRRHRMLTQCHRPSIRERLRSGYYSNRDNPAPFESFSRKYIHKLQLFHRRNRKHHPFSFHTPNPDGNPPTTRHGYWDSGCTYAVTPFLELCTKAAPIVPFTLGTSEKSNKGITLTHVGEISGLPPPVNRIYYCREAACTLFSLGWFLHHDYSFTFPRIHGTVHQRVQAPDGTTVSDTVLGKNFIFKLPSHFLHAHTAINNGVSYFAHGFAAAIHFDDSDEPHFTKPQRTNIKIAKTIHLKYGHLPLDRMISAVDNHCFDSIAITKQDVINFFNTKKCTCLSTRMHMPPNPPSQSPIAQTIGGCVTVDINALPSPSYGAHTQEITSYDELSTKGHIVGMVTKKKAAVTAALLKIKSRYKARSHTLAAFLSDSEANFQSTCQSINDDGTLITHTAPLEHCKRNERFQQRINNLTKSTLDLLPYILPSKYAINTKQHSIHIHNSMPNSITIDRSPDQKFDGCIRSLNPNFPFLPYGGVCSVKSHALTMMRRATQYNTDVKYISPSETGVNLGWDDEHPMCNIFLLSNGLMIFRKIFTPLDDSVIPFGWTPKIADYRIPPTVSDMPDTTSTITPDNPSKQPIATLPISNTSKDTISVETPPLIVETSHPAHTHPHTPHVAVPDEDPNPFTLVPPRKPKKKPMFVKFDMQTRSRPLTKALLLESSVASQDTDYYLFPPAIKKEELTHKQALLHPAAASCSIALDIEISGLIETLNALGPEPTAFDDIEPHAAIIPNKVFYKHKPSLPHQWKCRLVLGGNLQPSDTYGDIYAGMTDSGVSILIIALCQADSITHNYTLHVSGFDITMAFPKVRATPENCPRPMYTRIAPELNHRLSGKYLRVNGLVYGSKQANHEFDKEETLVILSAGFSPIEGDSHVFIRRDPTDPTMYCIVSTHVDDGRPIYSERGEPYYNDLIAAHELRWGKLTIQNPLTDYLTHEYSYNPNRSITISMGKYIAKVLRKAGLVDVPDADSPCTNDLFEPTNDPTPVPRTQYQSVVGLLIYCLPIRHDLRLPIGHMSRANLNPTRGDLVKVIRILRHLQKTPDLGLTLHSTSGHQLSFSADASHGCHPNGRSQEAYGLHVGNNPAPVFAYSSMNLQCVTTSAFESEYVVLSKAAKKLIHFCNISNQLGFQQIHPLHFFSDNGPSIGLTEAHEISKKSKHVNNVYHFIRQLVKEHYLKGTHVNNQHNHINLLTKPLQGAQFLFERDNLMNVAARITSQPPTIEGAQLLLSLFEETY